MKFFVTDQDGCAHFREIDAVSPQSAAELWAQRTFVARGCQSETTAFVIDPHGNVTQWAIQTETVPLCRAAFIDRETPCGDSP